jgi:3-carboxy-cis,cis-muconate cycloisomerase
MRPSSSPSDAGVGGLFDGVLGRGPVAAAVSDAGWLRALLDVEAALARSGAAVGLIPAEAAERIGAACQDVSAYDVAALGAEAVAAGNPVVPLVRWVERLAGPDAGAHVHRGATSQDVLDTAMMLVARRAVELLRSDLHVAAGATARLAELHRTDPVIGRTLLQHALPTTFGLKAAGWLSGLDAADDRLAVVNASLPVQLFGAVGTCSAAGGRGPELVDALAVELGLTTPRVAWHTLRLPVADLAGALGTVAGVVGKIALDVTLMAQTEVAEVAEGVVGRGGSSTMPHKANPVAAVSARAATMRVPGLVATLLAGMAQEHERAAGAWHSEWQALTELLRSTGSAVAWLRDCLGDLRVETRRMHGNLSKTSGALAAEALAGALAPALGRASAHQVVAAAARRAGAEGCGLAEALAADEQAAPHLRHLDLPALLSASSAPGQAAQLVDRALEAHRERGERR